MNQVAFMRELVAKGMSWEDAAEFAEKFEEAIEARVAEALEAVAPKRSKAAERQAAYRARRHNGEHNTEHNAVTPGVMPAVMPADNAERNEPLSLPPSPQTPQPPTHTRVSVTTREALAREDAAFGRFWAEYPRKTAKADARKAFGRAWKKLPPEDAESILLGALVCARASWSDAQFIPHAATWLNGERWTDEPPPATQPRQAHDRTDRHASTASSRAARRGVWSEVLAEECGTPTGLRNVS